MDITKFIAAVKQQDCCGSCRFFSGIGATMEERARAGNATGSRSASGECRRFPPVIVRHRKGRHGDEEPEWESPSIKVVAAEYEDDGGVKWMAVTAGDCSEDVPWCGEYQPAKNLDYFDIDDL